MPEKLNLYKAEIVKAEAKFILGALILAGLAFWLAWFLIEAAMTRQAERILYTLHMRAEALAGSLEGAARFTGARRSELGRIFTEIARQPGIAWLALVDPDGSILIDSSPGLAGSILYSKQELAALNPDYELQGRLGIDDPDIYEAWTIFSPERLTRRARAGDIPGGSILFVALNAAHFKEDMAAFKGRLWLIASLAIFALTALLALIHTWRRYRASRRKTSDMEALARQVIQSFPAGLLVAAPEGKVLFVNNKLKGLLPALKTSSNLFANDSLDWKGLFASLQKGASIYEQDRILTGSPGQTNPISLSASLIKDSFGDLAGVLIIIKDMREVDRLKRELRESERLSALGKLSAGLAHEIRNPLSSICGYACYLEQKLACDPLAQTTARLLVDETKRVNAALTDLLCLSREPKLALAPVSIENLLRKAIMVALPDAQNKAVNLELACGFAKDLQFSLDKDKLLQALLNLLLNAIQFTPANGKISVKAELFATPPPLFGADAKGECLQIEVSDTGSGIPEADLNQIFNPYFTTRANGVGLGLSIARQIVEAHKGCITVTSKPGQGSTFTIYLPARAPDGKDV